MKITKLPTNIDEFKVLRDELAITPEGGAAMFVIALKLFVEDPQLGLSCLIMQREINDLTASNAPGSYMGYMLNASEFSLMKSQLAKQPYIPASYFVGTTPQNSYSIPTGGFEMDITTNPYSGDPNSGKVKLFIRSSGADMSRPVAMVRNDKGLWKVKEYSSLIVGIKKSASEERQDNL
jgi:hypothetical protein